MRNFSPGLGAVEIAIALLIAAGPIWPKLSTLGSLAAIGIFLTTLSFLITNARSMAGRVWISRPLRVSRPVSGQGCSVVGSGYVDPGRFSEMRNCCKRRPLKRIETAALISAGNIFADVYACLQSRGSTAARTSASLLHRQFSRRVGALNLTGALGFPSN